MSTPAARALVLLAAACVPAAAATALTPSMQAQLAARPSTPRPLAPMHATPCVDGMAGIYPCSNVDLLSFTPLSQMAAVSSNSLWGWTDPDSGTEYALFGLDNGTAFFDLSKPDHPLYLGKLPTHAGTGSSLWRDVRVYANHAFIVSDNNPGHGMQVFDLTRLRGVTTPQTFTEDAHYNAFGSSHTISINEETGYAYVAGSSLTCPGDSGHGGLQMIDIHDPLHPTYAGCVGDAGYTHEAQCWVYHGPDTEHQGREICLDSNGSSGRLAIVDVTDKPGYTTLSSTGYAGSVYTHQAWFSEDQRYVLLDDELDEEQNAHEAYTYVFDVSDLDHPVLVGHHGHGLPVIDHNLYVHGQFVYASDYEAGLRILRIDNLSQAQMTEVAYIDIYPQAQTPNFNGNWNNYRFPDSGIVILTGIEEGMFVVRPNLCSPPEAPTAPAAVPGGDHRINLSWTGSGTAGATFRVERAQGGCEGSFRTIADAVGGESYADTTASGSINYGYRIAEHAEGGQCASAVSSCVEAQTTGTCTAPPIFAGVASAEDAGASTCRIDLGWASAAPACGGPANYAVYRSDVGGFSPSPENRIADGLSTLGFSDPSAAYGTLLHYIVRSTDAANGTEDDNMIELVASAHGPATDGTFESGAEPGDPPLETAVGPSPAAAPAEPMHAGWHLSSERFHTGTQSFWSTRANNLCVTLVTPPLLLTAGQASTLSFWSAWDIEQGWDGGVVEVSTDDGTTWTRLRPQGGYPGVIDNGGTLCGVAVGDGAYTGMGHFGWSRSTIDLAPWAGRRVKLRWLYRTDAAQTGEGWFVDDIALTHAQVPGECSADGDGIFSDGFDAAMMHFPRLR